MTWKEFVDEVEAAGVQDADVLDFIDVLFMPGPETSPLTIDLDPLHRTVCVSNC